MQKVADANIYLTRGDTFLAQVSLTKGGQPYTPQEGDVIKFVAKHDRMNADGTNYADSEPVIQKTIPNDTMLLSLQPSDTKQLGFGNYVYDMEMTFADGSVDTFISQAVLKILPESN